MGIIPAFLTLVLAPIFGIITASKTKGSIVKKGLFCILGMFLSTVLIYVAFFAIYAYLLP